MHKLKFLIILIFGFFSLCFAEESITITTYYPSPYGVYNELQLYAHNPAVTTCDDAHKGTMFYKSTDDQVYVCKGATLGWQTLGGSKVVQIVSYETGAYATGTTPIPDATSIPQNNEGDLYMTLAITPKSATNKLKIDVVFNASSGQQVLCAVALFRDNVANALAVAPFNTYAASTQNFRNVPLTYIMDVPDTTTHTFYVRAGTVNAGWLWFNWYSDGSTFGGVVMSSITITEYAP